VRFTASPQIIGYTRPSETVLNQLAAALAARGCTILNIGRFGISVDASEEIFKQLQADHGKDDLSILDALHVAPPPIYFAD
jgi:hypothetical protein